MFDFLELPSRSSLAALEEGTRRICTFSMGELIGFNARRDSSIDPGDVIQMCFRASFVTSFLMDGIGFPREYVVEAVSVINGQKVGWALGSMLYEVRLTYHTTGACRSRQAVSHYRSGCAFVRKMDTHRSTLYPGSLRMVRSRNSFGHLTTIKTAVL